jgi:GGDEF domain-containing protein
MNTIGSKIASHTKRLIIWQFLCVCVPVVALFLLPTKQILLHKERYQATFDETAQTITRIKADGLREKIALIGADALSLSTQASELFTYSDRFNHNANFYKEGDLYKNETKKPFSFYTPNELNQDARKKASRLLLLLPLLEARTNAMPVSSGFVYLEDPFALVYPPVESVDLNASSNESLYESVRKNPRKQWRLSINGGLKIVAPVFAGARPIGVAGFELSKEKLFGGALEGMPQKGFAFIADTQNKTILYGSVSGGFGAQSYFAGVKQEGFKLIEEEIEGLPIAFVYAEPIAEIDPAAAALYRELIYIAAIITASVLLFYLAFSLRSVRTARKLTETIVRPLDIVARFSYRLGTRKADRLEAMGITEFDDFANHMRLTHSKLLPSLTIDEATGLYNRRALLEDLEGKGPFGLIAISVHLRCDDDSLFSAAFDYALKRSSELIGRVISGGDSIYAIGANRLAILTNIESRERLAEIAKKIVDMIDNGSFEFHDITLKATAIFGAALGDKSDNGAKLIANAEADMLKRIGVRFDEQKLETNGSDY